MSVDAPPRTTSEFFRYLGCIAQCGRCARSIKWIMEEPSSPPSQLLIRRQLPRLPNAVDVLSFAAVVRCTADPVKADKRTWSKWSRVMRYAAAYKPDSEPLEQFIQRKSGINACAARFPCSAR
jgi:hypothetical protein